MTKLGQSNPYFVRCIKPNIKKVAGDFNSDTVLAQLKYSGMMETVRIRRSGYPVRRPFGDFMFRYNMLGRKLAIGGKEEREGCIAIMSHWASSTGKRDWQMGKTKVHVCMCV